MRRNKSYEIILDILFVIALIALMLVWASGCAPVVAPSVKPKLIAPHTMEQYLAPPIDVALINAIIKVESGGNPKAVSHKGAIGLMQVMPATGRSMGYTKAQLHDPTINVEAGTRYLTLMYQRTGTIEGALAAYYCGPGKYRRNACKAYARKVLRVKGA